MPEHAADEIAVLLRIEGRVQGVYYRASAEAEAARLALRGWVRNRRDGSVEALVAGSATAIEAFVDWAWVGSDAAQVERIHRHSAPLPDGPGFVRLPTA